MIGSLRGRIIVRRPPRLMVEVGGVGYELEAPLSTFEALPADGEVRLHTHLMVREDTQQLFAFATERERELFRVLIRASGVGAKLALAILSGLSVDEFARAVAERDIGTLKRLPGIGQKTAERLVVEMADRIAAAGTVAAPGEGGRAEAEAALEALGYKPREIASMLAGVTVSGRSSEEVVRDALKQSLRKGR